MSNKKVDKTGKTKSLIKSLCLIGVSFFFICSGIVLLWVSSFRIPDLSSFEERKIAQSTKIFDRTGEVLLYDVHQNIKRTVVSIDNVSRHMKNAIVAIEDAEFYQHSGIKPKSILRALLANLTDLTLRHGQGGSTITQQVVKNTVLTSEKKISRKLKEWVLAIKLEKQMDKEQILELYLNETPFGGSIYGVEEASARFFKKTAKDLTLTESAYLAALPQAPTYYSPYGNNREQLENRKNLVLEKMLENSFISKEEYVTARDTYIEFQAREDTGILAPHFVIYVREYIESKYGDKAIEEKGLKITTTLDYELQIKAQEIVNRHTLENAEKFNATNGSMVAIDPKTGQILVMIGSRNYFDQEIDGNYNVALAHRQPGSAFKPFVYATAFKKGLTPETTVFDLQTQFSTECDADGKPLNHTISKDVCYTPQNYDKIYRGPVTLRDALAQSINIPAIKTLYLAGLPDSLRTARELGITSLTNIDRYGLTLVLGGGEVSLLEMTSAYGVFANEGVRNEPVSILKIETAGGEILEEYTQISAQVLPKDTALTLSDVLSDNTARTPAFGANSFLYFNERPVAAKTGTTNDYRDAWIIGYTPSLSVGAWAGNNDNSPMEKKVAGFIVAPMWNEFMKTALQDKPIESFKVSLNTRNSVVKPVLRGIWQGGVSYMIDSVSGKLATAYTPYNLQKERVVQDVHTILHWVDKKDITGASPLVPQLDSQYNLWEIPVRKWVITSGIKEETIAVIPTEYDDIHKPEYSPTIDVQNFRPNGEYKINERINLLVNNQIGATPLNKADFFINDVYIGSTNRQPLTYSFTPSEILSIKPINTLRVVGYDPIMNKGEYIAVFRIVSD